MLCYKDMTFCPFYKDCGLAHKCSRPLTEQVLADARKWWGEDGAPIAQFTTKPACHTRAIIN